MRCGNCGAQLKQGETFCRNCGAQVSSPNIPAYSAGYDVRKKRSPAALIIVIISVVIIAVAVIALFLFKPWGNTTPSISESPAITEDDEKVKEYLELGQRYLRDGNYEQAAIAFEKAIRIDEKNIDAYRYLSESYIGMGDAERAAEVLRQGIELTDDRRLRRLLDEALELIEEVPTASESAETSESTSPTVSETPEPPATAPGPAVSTVVDGIVSIAKIEIIPLQIPEAVIETHDGAISAEKQIDAYNFVPPRAGRYRFELSGMPDGIAASVYIVNAGNQTVDYDYSSGNGGGVTTDKLVAGNTYRVEVRQYSGMGSYRLNIGIQNEKTDVSTVTQVLDSIRYKDQINRYNFVPARSGRYRFELSGMPDGIAASVYIVNAGNQTVDYDYSSGNGGGVTTDKLVAGDNYEVQVRQYSGLAAYHLNILPQKETVDISKVTEVSDSIQMKDQINRYSFTPRIAGRYRFELSGMPEGIAAGVYIVNAGNQTVDYDYGSGNGGGVTTDKLTAGETYSVQVHQYSGLPDYKLCVWQQKETGSFDGVSEVTGSIQFKDQIDNYSFSPQIAGKYRLEISGLPDGIAVGVYIVNAGNQVVDYDYSSGNGGGVTTDKLTVGEPYTVQIRHYSGFGNYKLSVVLQ